MIRMEVKGLQELERQLLALGEKVGTQVLRDAGKAALEPVLEDMKAHAGYDESAKDEHMRDSIKIRSSSSKAKGNAVVYLRVGPSKKTLHQSAGTGDGHREAGRQSLHSSGAGLSESESSPHPCDRNTRPH